MAESTKIKSVLIDGELADISTDNDNYAGIFTHEEQEVVEEPEKEEEKRSAVDGLAAGSERMRQMSKPRK